jgi:hypothetical protein
MSDSKIPAWRSVLQYWAYNMNLIHRGKMEWPGFGYTDAEKEQLAALSAGLSELRFMAFLFVNTVLFLALGAFVFIAGVLPVAVLLDPNHQSGMVFLGSMAGGTVVLLGFGLPATMAWSALALNMLLSQPPPGAVSDEEAAALYHKMNRQITRMGVILGILLIPLVIFGSTRIGGHFMDLAQRIVTTVMPFAVLITAIRAMAPSVTPKK